MSKKTIKKNLIHSVTMPRLRNYQTLCNLGWNAKHKEGWYPVPEIRKQLLKLVDINRGEPERRVIRKVAGAMDITGRDLAKVVDEIWRRATSVEKSTPMIRQLMRQLGIRDNTQGRSQVVWLLYQILYPEGFPEHAIESSQDAEYKRLIAKQRSERDGPSVMTADETKRLEAMMAAKVCKCVKERYLLYRFRYLVCGLSPEGIPPEAMCQWSIFNQRGMQGFDLHSCDRRFRWYRDLKRVTKRSFPDFPPQDLRTGKMIEEKKSSS